MDQYGVCAVIVTFRPKAEYIGNIAKVRAQVEKLVVVDNGSGEDELHPLRSASRKLGFALIEVGENLGVASALNIGVRWAQENGAQWVVLFDQDSTVTEHFVSWMIADFEQAASHNRLGLLVPRYIDPISGKERVFGVAEDNGPLVTITSGSFFPTRIFETCGYFREELFIYTVDDEYSLRLRSHGYSIAQSRRAMLLHASGQPTHYYLLGKKLFSPSNHSPAARYYLNRNRIWMLRTYGLRYPRWTCWIMIASVKEVLMILLGETNRRLKLGMMLFGLRDGVLMRMGKTVDF